jgi:hypothetical protein
VGAVLLNHLVMKIFVAEETLDLAVEKDSQCTVSGLMLCFAIRSFNLAYTPQIHVL